MAEESIATIRQRGAKGLPATYDFSHAILIDTGDVGYTDALSKNPILATAGAGPCTIVALYAPAIHQAALAHIAPGNDPETLRVVIQQLRRQHGDGLQLEAHLAGALPQMGEASERNVRSIVSLLQSIPGMAIRSADIMSESDYALSLVIDSRNGVVYIDGDDRFAAAGLHKASRPTLPGSADLLLSHHADQKPLPLALTYDSRSGGISESVAQAAKDACAGMGDNVLLASDKHQALLRAPLGAHAFVCPKNRSPEPG